ncbi:TetR/AcrR family transcriptional regulator [Rhizobium sp. L1K21]|uniref:TetR/AcrR family transcriptional regulator n=1 Tax=Rhizobium sp. L1K21 TaxID=2954933 RepID=UPI002093CC39|nr:TetR/AcrR family transcriptional regulator [Rhizobium sp. L1K21]MCO6188445.1 TetR/AcrR family transcriptional regulator [Rhizobium sp. L1K21]
MGANVVAQEDVKKRAILAAARELFFAQGYDTTSMDEVAKQAGVSKATVYAHFDNKERLLLQLVGESVELMQIDHRDVTFETHEELSRVLRRLATQFNSIFLVRESAELHRLLIAQAHKFEAIGQAFYEAGPLFFEREVSYVLRQGVEKKLLEIGNIRIAAAQFLALVVGTLPLRTALSLPATEAEDMDATIDAGLKTFFAAFSAPALRS